MAQENFMYCNEFLFGKFGTKAQKGKRIKFTYEGVNEILIHTPILHVPYSNRDKKSNGITFMKTIPLSLTEITLVEKSKSNNKHIKAFKQFVTNIDEYVKEEVLKDYSEIVYSSLYKDTFNVCIKLDYNTKDPLVEVFNKNQIVEYDDNIFKNKLVTCIIKLESIWVSNGKAGVNWNMDSIQILEDYNPKVTEVQSTPPMLIQSEANESEANESKEPQSCEMVELNPPKCDYYLRIDQKDLNSGMNATGYFLSNPDEYDSENKLIDSLDVLLKDYPSIEFTFHKTRIPENEIQLDESKTKYCGYLNLKELLTSVVTGKSSNEFSLVKKTIRMYIKV